MFNIILPNSPKLPSTLGVSVSAYIITGVARMSGVQAINQWFSFIERHHSATTIRVYKQIAFRFLPCLPKNIEDITLEHLESYLTTLHTSNITVNNNITTLKSFGKWLADRDYPNPATKLHYLKVPHKQQRTLTESEYRCVLTISGKDRWIIEVLGNTGLRAAEFLSIKKENIKGDFLYVNGKGSKIRAIPLNETAKKALINIDLIKSIHYHTLNLLCHRLSVKANIKDFCPHALRRYFATELLTRGIDIYRVSKALGHNSVSITEKLYVRFNENLLQGITNVL